MAKLRIGSSYWLDRYGGPGPAFPSLRGHHEADVVVIGGGVTGCSCAYLFRRAGARVLLVEARRIGRGSTAASTALLMQEPDADFIDLSNRYGRHAARAIWHQSRKAVRSLAATLQALHVEASLERLPSVYFTRKTSEVVQLRRELKARRNAWIGGRWVSPATLRRITGFEGAGAIITTGNAQVDPYRACLGLARAARAAGAELFERSPVVRMKALENGIEATLRGGRIRARWAVIATGYATEEFQPLAGRFRMMNTYVIATRRLRATTRKAVGLGHVMLWDTERPYHYARWTPDGRLLFGGQDRPQVHGRTRVAALRERISCLSAELGDLYPSLCDAPPAYAWEGLFAQTPDGLPYIGPHRRYPHHLFALGYGGNGMTFGFLAGEALVRAARGRATPEDALFAFGRLR